MKFLVFLLSLLSAVNSLVLNCDFKYFVDLEDQSKELYACVSMNFENLLQSASLHYVTNLHEHGHRDRDVKILTIRKQICKFIPHKIENHFPHLQEIEIDSSGLRKVNRDNFADLPYLKTVILPGNLLEVLPGDLFLKNPRIMHFDVSKNQIKSIGPELFDNLHHLEFLKFDDNICFEGFDYFETDPEIIRDEVLANCSSTIRKEKKMKIDKNEDKSVDLKPRMKSIITTTSKPIIGVLKTTTFPPFEINEIPIGRNSEPKQLVSESTRISISSTILIVTAIYLLLQQHN